MAATTKYMPRMKAHYLNTVRADLMKQLELKNPMQVPTIEKIVINMGVGKATQQASLLDGAVADLTAITGQKPLVTKSRIAIASFKLRENQAIGCKVTMRGDRMWEFFDRMLSIAIPRIRDFRGLSGRSWDGNGNYTFGLTEQLAFMEVRVEQVDTARGMDITIVTTAKSDIAGKALLDAFGFPFRKGEVPASVTKAKKSKKK
ncbi:MAG: 50S ribosomal protein L5 [Actinobacteria bacterium]|nr:50S ribosomal protein L5 [Actinomycetota bacterium]NCW84042.1 50S ribosomal protein L5 [Acidimicrobiia bacterium]HBQ51982.1 50S ribosomal protein L5 [Acidimicrobium sp.]NBQ04921.1 50S ribosomal protein L5 [Actinomycetota bacterium]NBY62126.1 50S ribosomal protein L5 [Actinomycetota bacterium]